jgi:uncharacterized membrane protein
MNVVLKYISHIITIVSITVVVYGALVAAISFLRNELTRLTGKFSIEQLRELRVDLGSYILLGLELLIASDILKTILEPGLKELGILGGIVFLRTVLSFFLNKEISEIYEEHRSGVDDSLS